MLHPVTKPSQGRIAVVSGCPGTGKTTLARELARRTARGVHMLTDVFYDFIPHRIHQTLPESNAQNTTVMHAIAAAAVAYANGGYDVYADGVISTRFLEVFRLAAGAAEVDLHFIMLRTSLDETVRRGTARSGPDFEATIRIMHAKLADLGELEPHAIDASPAAEEILAHAQQQLDAGALRLSPASAS